MKICLARGDLEVIPFAVYIDGVQEKTSMDEIYFTVKKHYYDESEVFQKRLSDGGIESDGEGAYVLSLNPEDTESLPFGTYDCDIEIVRDPDIKRTFNGTLEISREVTHKSNEGV